MLTYHNDQEVKTKYQNRMEAHIAADELRQGDPERCAIGCALDRYSHDDMARELGWPMWLVHWYEQMFEGLPASDGPEFCRSILAAVPVGADERETERWRHAIAVRRLNRLLQQTQQPAYVESAIKQVIAYHANPDRTEEMRLAAEASAESALSVAWAERSPAAKSAAWAAESAAWSVRLAWESARSAAESARWSAALSREDAKSVLSAEYRAQWRDFLDVVTTKEPE